MPENPDPPTTPEIVTAIENHVLAQRVLNQMALSRNDLGTEDRERIGTLDENDAEFLNI